MALRWFKSQSTVRRYRRKPSVSGVRHGDRIVLMDVGGEQFYSLDQVGGRIWELLADHDQPDAIATAITSEFAAPADVVRRDVDEFLDQLSRDGLIEAAR